MTQPIKTQVGSIALQEFPGTSRIAVIGCQGFNFKKRVLPELAGLDPNQVVGYDLAAQHGKALPFPSIQVADDHELAARLNDQCPNVVLIETPDSCHVDHIPIALAAGARLVICEKPLATSIADADDLVELCQQHEPDQKVFILDHYMNIELLRALFTLGREFVGDIKIIEAVLFESQGIPDNQIRSHEAGMANFLHHCIAVSKLANLTELEPTAAVWANHKESPVRDTYRGVKLCSRENPQLTIRAAVGKYIANPTKYITVKGSHGEVMLDRDGHRIELRAKDGWSMTITSDQDTGYRGIAECLAGGKPLSSFLDIADAREVVRLVEEAHAGAVEEEYPDGSVAIFSAEPGSQSKRAA